MKKIIIFIGLKVVEIAGIVFVPYFIGLSGFFGNDSVVGTWFNGIGIMAFGCLIILACFGFYAIARDVVKMNWEWAKKLSGDKS